ncbi:hypothetical protein TNCV_822121 [Trichonephila clavipes]|nr:hypothetical protein TNCV_822121 [Trichonephila clavipes]
MWFKILFTNQHYPLAAMVGKDGKIYFRPVDVGAFIGRSSVYKFTKRFDLPNLPNFGVHVPRSFGKKVIVFTSHLDLTWDKGGKPVPIKLSIPPIPSDRSDPKVMGKHGESYRAHLHAQRIAIQQPRK